MCPLRPGAPARATAHHPTEAEPTAHYPAEAQPTRRTTPLGKTVSAHVTTGGRIPQRTTPLEVGAPARATAHHPTEAEPTAHHPAEMQPRRPREVPGRRPREAVPSAHHPAGTDTPQRTTPLESIPTEIGRASCRERA